MKGEYMPVILKAENITKKFNDNEKILKGITLSIENETFTAILGPSGSGKSTLLNVLSGLLKATSGRVWYKDKDITLFNEGQLADWKRNEVSNIFQNYMLLNNLTAGENIKIGISNQLEALSFERLVHLLKIDSILDKFPAQLSGGQQQRVAIARAVIKKPSILFCDEATGALDEANSKQVVELLHDIKKNFGVSILFVTHNLQIAETADRLITIKDGLVSADRINQNPISACDMIWG
jgi:putative ABC transport system ATP-binding protein